MHREIKENETFKYEHGNTRNYPNKGNNVSTCMSEILF